MDKRKQKGTLQGAQSPPAGHGKAQWAELGWHIALPKITITRVLVHLAREPIAPIDEART